jgi:hypothetical protein
LLSHEICETVACMSWSVTALFCLVLVGCEGASDEPECQRIGEGPQRAECDARTTGDQDAGDGIEDAAPSREPGDLDAGARAGTLSVEIDGVVRTSDSALWHVTSTDSSRGVRIDAAEDWGLVAILLSNGPEGGLGAGAYSCSLAYTIPRVITYETQGTGCAAEIDVDALVGHHITGTFSGVVKDLAGPDEVSLRHGTFDAAFNDK